MKRSALFLYLFSTLFLQLLFNHHANAQGSTTVTGDCGSATIIWRQLPDGKVQIVLGVDLVDTFQGPLFFVWASGYWFNSRSFEREPLSSPGGLGQQYDQATKSMVDTWIITTEPGRVTVGFPYITSVALGGFCFGLFPETSFIVASGGGGSGTFTAALNEVKADDVAIVVDTTGSMRDDIAAVKSQVASILDELEATSADFRVAVVGYNDPSANVVQTFTRSRSAITSAINSLGASGGGDTPEHVYSGIRLALQLDWRRAATRRIIVIGDAPPKDPEPGTGLTRAKILQMANEVTVNLNPSVRQVVGLPESSRQLPETIVVPAERYIQFLMIAIGGSSSTISSFQALADGTNGKLFRADSAAQVVDVLKEALNEGSSESGTGGAPQGPVKKLILTSICWTGRNSHRLRVRNPNSFNVDYRWEVFRTNVKGEGTAKPGDNFFVASGISRGATVKLFWENEKSQTKSTTKALNTRNC